MHASVIHEWKFLLLCFILLVAVGCGKTDLRLDLSAGDTRTVILTNETAQGSDAKGPSKTLAQYRFHVESVDPEGNHTMHVTIEKGGFTEMGELDALTNVLPGLDAITLDGKEFQTVIGPRGAVRQVQGMDENARELADKMVQAIQQGMAETKNVPDMLKGQLAGMMGQMEGLVRKMVRQQIGDAAMRDQLNSIFSMYVDKPVRKGSEWTKAYAVEAPLPMNVNEKWTLVERSGDIVKLAFSSEVTSNPNAPGLEFMGMKMSTSVTGKVTGTAELELKTGWPRRIDSDMDLNIEVSFMGMSMPRKMLGKQTWETLS